MGIGNPAKKTWNLIKSKTFAVILIFVLVVVSALGVLVPKLSVFQTRWFAVLGVVFFMNLTACTLQQLMNAFRLWRNRHQLIKNDKNFKHYISDKNENLSNLAQFLQKRGYDVVPGNNGNLLWTKHNFGIWGASIFHIGLILIIIGAFISGALKMSGYMKIAEGEVRYEQHENFEALEEGPFFNEAWHTGVGITLNKQRVQVDKNGLIENVISDISIMKGGGYTQKASLGEKESVIYDGLRIFEKDSGFAPFIEIAGPDQATLLKSYLLLETDNTGTPERFYLKGFQLPNTTCRINIDFYPDMVVQGNKITTNKLILSNPCAVVSLTDANRKIAEKVIRPGQSVDLQGYSLKMGEIKQWSGFDIVNDQGADYVFGGSWVALVGLILMYLFPYKKIQIYRSGNNLPRWEIIGATNRQRKIFEEELQELQNPMDNLIQE
jgi:cytochrome c biogenesis protein ResB